MAKVIISVNLLSSPTEGLFISSTFEWAGGGEGGGGGMCNLRYLFF